MNIRLKEFKHDIEKLKEIINEVKDPAIKEMMQQSIQLLDKAQTYDELFAAIPQMVKQEMSGGFTLNKLIPSAPSFFLKIFSEEKQNLFKKLRATKDEVNRIMPFWKSIYDKVFPLTTQAEKEHVKYFLSHSSPWEKIKRFCEEEYEGDDGYHAYYGVMNHNYSIVRFDAKETKTFADLLKLINKLNFNYLKAGTTNGNFIRLSAELKQLQEELSKKVTVMHNHDDRNDDSDDEIRRPINFF